MGGCSDTAPTDIRSRKIRVLLNREGWKVGKYLVERIYREEGLALRLRRQRRRRVAEHRRKRFHPTGRIRSGHSRVRTIKMSNLDSMLERNKYIAARQSAAGTLMPSLPHALPNVRAIIIG